MWKRAIVVFNMLLNIFLLSGCWSYVEIDQQISVSGIAIDIGEHGKKYHLSAEILSVDQKEKSKINANVIETDGDTIFEAINDLTMLSSKKLYFGHCKTMVIGEEIAKNGITELLDLPVRSHELRTTIDIVISKGCSAKEILMTEGVATSIISYKINNLLKNSQKAVGGSAYSKTYMIYNSIQAEGCCTAIPVLEIQKIEDKKLLKLCGSGVFKKDRMVGFLNEQQTMDLSFANNEIKTGIITTEAVDDPHSNMSFEIYKSKTKTEIQFKDGEITVNVSVKTAVEIGEVEIEADYTNSTATEKIRLFLEKELEKDIYLLIDIAQKDMKCDIFGIGMQINKNYPEMWNKYKNNWEEIFPKVKFNVKCEVKINGTGVTNKSA